MIVKNNNNCKDNIMNEEEISTEVINKPKCGKKRTVQEMEQDDDINVISNKEKNTRTFKNK